MGRDLLCSRPDWEASLRRCTELGRRHDATVIFGHDPDQFDRFDELL
jgi:glyoxylase-like metal-dependent hydrolase (beta-lactamase superfamily II)